MSSHETTQKSRRAEEKFLVVKPRSLQVETKAANGPLATRRVVRGKPRRGRRNRRMGAPLLPPKLDRITAVRTVRRLSISSNASNAAVTRDSLASTLGGIVTVANTTVTMWASSYRILKIVVWPAAGSTVTLDAVIGGTAEQALNRESMPGSDMPSGITLDVPLVFRPRRESYLSLWQTVGVNGTDQLFALSGASGAIIDLHMQYTLFSGVGAVGKTATTSSTVPLGDVVYMPMDTGNKTSAVALNTANH